MSKAPPPAKRKMVGVRIADDLHKPLSEIALMSGVSLQEVIDTVLRHHVRAHYTAFPVSNKRKPHR